MATDAELQARLLPPLDDANRAFWTGGRDGQLLIQRCGSCGTWVHPPVPGPHEGCGGELTPQAVSGRGTVWTFTVNEHPFNPTVPPPYVLALVELDEQPGLRCVTNLVHVEPAQVEIGGRVRVLFEEHGDVFVPLFEPDR
jgi:uncharacterized OB-fold protein